MANRAQKEKHARKLGRIGKGSLGITLPADLVVELAWKHGQKLAVKKIRGGLVVRDWKNR